MMCVDYKDFITLMSVFFGPPQVKIIGESIRLSVLEQPRICDSLCKNRISDFQVLHNVTPLFYSTISNARAEHLLAQMTKAKSLLFLQKKKGAGEVC